MAEAFTVSQVNRYIRDLLRRDALLRTLTVRGEVSNCTYHTAGHIYFTLKDKDGQLSCVMFAQDRGGLSFRLENGAKVRVTGRVDVWPQGGRYQFYAYGIEQEGAGEIYERFLKLKAQLEEEGLFSEEYKRPLPRYIRRLGIVTAATGAAVRDMIQTVKERNPYVQIVLYPSPVQGEGAAKSMIRGLRMLEAHGVDVIILGRGGGSTEDLWAFNDEALARAVFDCRIPVVSAVGHETDFTITDFVADLRAKTPTAAATETVFEYTQFEEELLAASDALYAAMAGRLSDAKSRLELQKERLSHRSPEARIRDLKMRQLRCEEVLTERMRMILARTRARIPENRRALSVGMQAKLSAHRQRLAIAAEKLNGRSPLTRLKAGYGYVTRPDGARVTEAKTLKKEDALRIYFADGRADAVVTDVSGHRFTTGKE